MLKKISKIYTGHKIYSDFCEIYDRTGSDVDKEVLEYITQLSKYYDEFATMMDILFSIIYLGMIAEENKENSILGKKIKRLGMHKILIEDMSAIYASEFMKNMNWKDIEKQCVQCGF